MRKNDMTIADIVAGLPSSNYIDFINIADIISSADVGTMVSIQQVKIVVNVFHLLQSQHDLGQPTELPQKGIEVDSIERELEDEMPRAKVIFLPSKEFKGVWNSYAIASVPLFMI